MCLNRQDRAAWNCALAVLLTSGLLFTSPLPAGEQPGKDLPPLVRSARSGPWSTAATWEGGKVPGTGSRVQVRTGDKVTYDVKSNVVIRLIHVAGTLTFAPDRDTRLDVGLITIRPGDEASEE